MIEIHGLNFCFLFLKKKKNGFDLFTMVLRTDPCAEISEFWIHIFFSNISWFMIWYSKDQKSIILQNHHQFHNIMLELMMILKNITFLFLKNQIMNQEIFEKNIWIQNSTISAEGSVRSTIVNKSNPFFFIF